MKSAMFLVVAVTLVACSGGETTTTIATPTTQAAAPTTTAPAGTPLDPIGTNPVSVFAPSDVGAYPVVVMVHGGGWVGGDPGTMAALAEGLSDSAVVFNVTYRTLGQGSRYPEIVEDVACDVVAAVARADRYTRTPDDVVLVAHSAGAHLAALVAFAPETFTCDGAVPSVRGFVGLAGPYDVTRLPILNTMFGEPIEQAPELWAEGNPLTHVAGAADVPILLIHGAADQVVPISFSEDLAEALGDAGAPVELIELPDVDHAGVRDPAVVGGLIQDFLGEPREPAESP